MRSSARQVSRAAVLAAACAALAVAVVPTAAAEPVEAQKEGDTRQGLKASPQNRGSIAPPAVVQKAPAPESTAFQGESYSPQSRDGEIRMFRYGRETRIYGVH